MADARLLRLLLLALPPLGLVTGAAADPRQPVRLAMCASEAAVELPLREERRDERRDPCALACHGERARPGKRA